MSLISLVPYFSYFSDIYVSGHPLREYEDILYRCQEHSIEELHDKNDKKDGLRTRSTCGVIIGSERKKDRNGSPYVRLDLGGQESSITCLVFYEPLDFCEEYIEKGRTVKVDGELSQGYNGGVNLIIDTLMPIEEARHILEKKAG